MESRKISNSHITATTTQQSYPDRRLAIIPKDYKMEDNGANIIDQSLSSTIQSSSSSSCMSKTGSNLYNFNMSPETATINLETATRTSITMEGADKDRSVIRRIRSFRPLPSKIAAAATKARTSSSFSCYDKIDDRLRNMLLDMSDEFQLFLEDEEEKIDDEDGIVIVDYDDNNREEEDFFSTKHYSPLNKIKKKYKRGRERRQLKRNRSSRRLSRENIYEKESSLTDLSTIDLSPTITVTKSNNKPQTWRYPPPLTAKQDLKRIPSFRAKLRDSKNNNSPLQKSMKNLMIRLDNVQQSAQSFLNRESSKYEIYLLDKDYHHHRRTSFSSSKAQVE